MAKPDLLHSEQGFLPSPELLFDPDPPVSPSKTEPTRFPISPPILSRKPVFFFGMMSLGKDLRSSDLCERDVHFIEDVKRDGEHLTETSDP